MWPTARAQVEESPTAREPWEAPRDVLIDKGIPVLDRTNTEVGVVENVVKPGPIQYFARPPVGRR